MTNDDTKVDALTEVREAWAGWLASGGWFSDFDAAAAAYRRGDVAITAAIESAGATAAEVAAVLPDNVTEAYVAERVRLVGLMRIAAKLAEPTFGGGP
jgi:hypothetical protein